MRAHYSYFRCMHYPIQHSGRICPAMNGPVNALLLYSSFQCYSLVQDAEPMTTSSSRAMRLDFLGLRQPPACWRSPISPTLRLPLASPSLCLSTPPQPTQVYSADPIYRGRVLPIMAHVPHSVACRLHMKALTHCYALPIQMV